MIPLVLDAMSEAERPYVTRLRSGLPSNLRTDSTLVASDPHGATYAGVNGLIAVDGASADELDGDVVLMRPDTGRVERLLRASSNQNTLLVTERCDQLCIMCSQPPKKTHVDRFSLLRDACLLAQPSTLIGISGGEPTLFKEQLFSMIEEVIDARPDLSFHVLTNGQHFAEDDIVRLRLPAYRQVSWGIPIYARDHALHDRIVRKPGALAALQTSLAHLIMAGARVELRTVVLQDNIQVVPELARFVAAHLQFVEAWSIMQLENIGFAKRRWPQLYVDHGKCFEPIRKAIDHAILHGVRAQLFNFPRCTVPRTYRGLAMASISDWKRKFAPACMGCNEKQRCSGFFEWHPDDHAEESVSPL